jgi:NADPH-dependent ferric siderophore reductase
MAVTAGGSSTRAGRPRPNPRRINVLAVHKLSPRMRRVTFGGPDLATFAWSGPAAHIKIIFPEPGLGLGLDTVAVPEPDGPRPATTRTYTPRAFDAKALTLDVDFVLHGHGPASEWAAQARIGQQLVMMGPGPGYALDTETPWYVLIGDDAALPAIETILDALPPQMDITVLLEVAETDEARTIAGPANADVRWLARGDDPQAAGTALLEELATFAWPAGEGRVYVGCESNAMRRIRQVVLEGSKLDRSRVISRGYWRVGAVNHPDRDYADD